MDLKEVWVGGQRPPSLWTNLEETAAGDGQFDVAREYYGKCLELALTQPELFDDGTRAFFRRKIAQFSSASATPD